MNKEYKEIEFMCGCNIADAVNELLEFKNQGILACGSFNGRMLYSDTVTIDGAYQEILGKTKAEYDKSQEEWREDYRRKEQEFQERIPTLSQEWEKRGREILTEDKFDYWDKIVPVRLSDLYHGMELGNCLDIVKILNNGGSLDEAKCEIEKQGHSGMSFGLVCNMVREFCERGNEFVEHVR